MYHGKINRARKKRKHHIGGFFAETTIGETSAKTVNTKGGGVKQKLVSAKNANVVLDGKNVKCEITALVENPANKDYTRRKIITKGAILDIKSPEGKALKVKVTSKPGQDGVINAKAV